MQHFAHTKTSSLIIIYIPHQKAAMQLTVTLTLQSDTQHVHTSTPIMCVHALSVHSLLAPQEELHCLTVNRDESNIA